VPPSREYALGPVSQLADTGSDDEAVQGQRRLHELIAAEPRVGATTIQTVGSKGYDGLTLALVTTRP
jgi:hypothetical protein